MIAAAGGQPDRCEEPRKDAEHRQRQRILQHRQHADTGDQRDRDRERGTRRHQAIQFVGRERHQHQRADGAALQRQRKRPSRFPLFPCEDQSADRCGGNRCQTQFDRHLQPALVAGVFQQRGNTGQQHQHADLHRHVALGEPAAHPVDEWPERIGRWRRRAAGARRVRAWRRNPGSRRSIRVDRRRAS